MSVFREAQAVYTPQIIVEGRDDPIASMGWGEGEEVG